MNYSELLQLAKGWSNFIFYRTIIWRLQKIRVHDLRHSHASLLIEMGCQPLLIADRLGHEKIQTTLNTYSHLYPNKQAEVAAQLENVMNGTTVPNGSQMAGVANL